MNYYNDNDEFVCQWTRNLIDAGLIPPGHVDSRSIKDVRLEDLRGFTQLHFFNGISGWPHALQLAGWPVDKSAWTCSCPCQPFSQAGRQKGIDDERHLWPEFFRLVDNCRPPIIFGEQVSGAAGARRTLSGKAMQNLQTAKILSGILCKQEGSGLGRLQRLLEKGAAAEESRYHAAAIGYFQALEETESYDGADFSGEISSQKEQSSIRSRRIQDGIDSALENRSMRNFRNPVSNGFHKNKNLGFPISGQDNTGAGICNNEHKGNIVRDQCNDECMGFAEDIRNSSADKQETRQQSIQEIFGISEEQSSWLEIISADLDRAGYTIWTCDLPALAVDADHIRQRLYWCAVRRDRLRDASGVGMADADDRRRGGRPQAPIGESFGRIAAQWPDDSTNGVDLADAVRQRGQQVGRSPSGDEAANGRARRDVCQSNGHHVAGSDVQGAGFAGPHGPFGTGRSEAHHAPAWSGEYRGPNGGERHCVALGDAEYGGCEGRHALWGGSGAIDTPDQRYDDCSVEHRLSVSCRDEREWIICHDGKKRRIPQSGFPLLVDGVSGRLAVSLSGQQGQAALQEHAETGREVRWISRVGAWRGFGNAIVPTLAAHFIRAVMESILPE